MRLAVAIRNDMRYQVKYGFYLLYVLISAIYAGVLMACPNEYKDIVASIILLTDPAMLGTFFIGGIWLLEKSEGLHRYILISPLRPREYILSKAISLGFISTLAADAILLTVFGAKAQYPLLSMAILLSSTVFTTIGLWVASFAKSLNQYMLLIGPLEAFVSLPPILAAFGITAPWMNALPGMAAWQIIRSALGFADTPPTPLMFAILVGWLAIGFALAVRRIPKALLSDTGESA